MTTLGEAFEQALAAYEAGDLEGARKMAKRIAAKNANFGGAPYLLGLIAGDLGQHAQAIHHLTGAVKLSPTESVPRLALGNALEMAGLPDRALVQYGAALELAAHHPANRAEIHARIGALLLAAEDLENAAQHFRDALEVHPDWSAVLNNLGLVEGRLGHSAAAVEALTKAVETSPDHAGFRVNLANALLAEKLHEAAHRQAEAAVEIDADYEDAWITLGLVCQALRQWDEAAKAFASALDLDPNLVSARWCLAECLRHLDLNEDAAAHYELCLTLDPEDRHGAKLGLALARGETPTQAPAAYVRQLFDDFADDFDRRLVDGLDYRAPQLLAERMAPLLAGRSNLSVVDLGCGTGLAAPVLRPYAGHLVGIDLSGKMLDKARERGLYDQLIEGDVLLVADQPQSYDLVMAADVLVYLGDLAPLFQAVAAALVPGGLFAFSVEHATQGDWVLGQASRYAHSEDYVQRMADQVGLVVRVLERASTRMDAGQPVPGLVVVAEKL